MNWAWRWSTATLFVAFRVPNLGEATRHLAEMSRRFDPFGYPSAFRTIAEPNKIVKTQHLTIQANQRTEVTK